MTDKHVSLPRLFQNGDIQQWVQKFEICAAANGWNDRTKALKVPTLLEGEALAVFLKMKEEDKSNYQKVKEALENEFLPEEARFQAMKEFETRKQLPGESPHLFLFNLKRLVMPGISEDAREQLLLHHFLDGVPVSISRQLRTLADITTVQDALAKARSLMTTLEDCEYRTPEKPAPLDPSETRLSSIEKTLEELVNKISSLSTAEHTTAAVLPRQTATRSQKECFRCGRRGHIARDCRSKMVSQCFQCGKRGHTQRECWWSQGNEQRPTARGYGPGRQ